MRKMHITKKYGFFQMTIQKRKVHNRVVENVREPEEIIQVNDSKKNEVNGADRDHLKQK